MAVSFVDRLALLLEFGAAANSSSLPRNAEELASLLSRELERPVPQDIVEAWIDGREVPSSAERRAIATCFGYADEGTGYLDSDDPSVYMPFYKQVSTFTTVVGNRSGLVALRPLSNEPLSPDAVEDLGRLG